MEDENIRLKMVIVGDGSTGKTVLLYAYMKKQYDEQYIPTVLDTYHAEIKAKDKRVTLEIYDTAGQEDFAQIRTLIYPGTDVFIMCYSCVFRPSLVNVQKFWVPETIKEVDPKTPIILVGNKLDLASEQPGEYISPGDVDDIIEKTNKSLSSNVLANLQCSARMEAFGRPGNVQTVFKTAIQQGMFKKLGYSDVKPPKKRCFCL